MTREQTGLFIIRAWFEDGSPKPLRATIRQTGDVATGIERERTLCDVDSVCAHVRAWLDDLEQDDRSTQ